MTLGHPELAFFGIAATAEFTITPIVAIAIIIDTLVLIIYVLQRNEM